MSRSPRLGRINTPKRRLFTISLLLVILATVGLYSLPSSSEAAATELFFSEYIEGSSNNKALEIYNGTGGPVNLSGYTLEMYFNGSTTAGFTLALSGSVPNNGTWVIAPTNANATILAAANQTSGTSWFNGDDAVVLKKNGVIVDSIGQVGFDPGTEWGTGLVSTADNTIRRKSTVCTGDTNATNVFDPSVEWDGFATDTFGGLGSHTATCGVTPTNGSLQFSAANYSVAENGGTVTITVTRTGGSDGVVSASYTTSNGTATSGADYATASGTVTFNNGESGSKTFDVTINDDAAFEGNETVNLSLSSPTGGATLGNPSTSVLTITDNDVAPTPTPVPAGSVVISQVYGGGGNSGATFKYDYIEIFNRSSNPVDLTGWSVQYTSQAGPSGGGNWSGRTNLSGTIQPGQYFLIQEASNNVNVGADLPVTPDVSGGTINMSGTDGKVALVRSTNFLSGTCPLGDPNIVDMVGYGGANCYEGSAAAPSPSAQSAIFRARNGCKDTDFNAVNFTEATPSPRNSTTALNVCPGGDEAPEVFSTSPTNGATNISLTSNITINFDQNVNVTGNWFQISCSTSGTHTATATSSTTTFTLDPDTNFVGDEQCTVTVYASQVTDQDAQDPPDFMVADYTFSFRTLIPRDPAEHLLMGNPTGAATTDNNNYLLAKDQYALSYNCDRGTSNWVSWHLDTSWLGTAPRQDDFRFDPATPPGCYQVQGTDYSGSGFDRGHMVPSADRTSSIPDNSATFFMTNMIPQAPDNNQGPWADLEMYERELVGQGNEVYIISGGVGTGGIGSNGARSTITNGNVTVPAQTWKVFLVLPVGSNDVARVDNQTRTFAVIMPNVQGIRNDDWRKYLATVDQVEALTGYDFFSQVNDDVEAVIEARLDEEHDTAPVASGQSVSTAEDTVKEITLSAADSNVNNTLTYTVVSGPSHGTLSGTGSQLFYTPAADYNGPDSFTFKANDGAKDSNTATVSINVTPVNDAPVANNDSANTDEDTAVTVSVLTNDTDAENDTLSVTAVGAASNGATSLVGNDVKYTPASNFSGTDSFSYTVSDGNGGTTTGTVNVTVAAVNDAPVANDDSATTDEDTSVTIDVRSNDTDVEGDTVSVTGASGATKGTVSVTADGRVLYTPNSNANGADSFSYSLSDGQGGTANGTVNVTINPVNDAPSVSRVPATAITAELSGYTFTAQASDNDGDTLTFSLVGAPAGATIDSATGQFNWTPTEAQGGTGAAFQFTVRVSDGTTNVDSNVSITVTEVNQAPTLAPIGNQTVLLGGSLTFTAQGADADLPTQALTYSLTGAVPAGASINPTTGQFNWTPTAAQAGQTYTFGVRVTDDGPGQLYAEEVITVSVGYEWSGLLQPINPNGTSIFKQGSTIPVKFMLTGASAGITNATVRLTIAKISDNVVGTEEEAVSTSAATTGNLFRYDSTSGQYIFNLNTKGLTPGTYQLRIDMGDGVLHVVNISLR